MCIRCKFKEVIHDIHLHVLLTDVTVDMNEWLKKMQRRINTLQMRNHRIFK